LQRRNTLRNDTPSGRARVRRCGRNWWRSARRARLERGRSGQSEFLFAIDRRAPLRTRSANEVLGGGIDGVLGRVHRTLRARSLVKILTRCRSLRRRPPLVLRVTAWHALSHRGTARGQTVLVARHRGGFHVLRCSSPRLAGAITDVTSSSDDKLEHAPRSLEADQTITIASRRRHNQVRELTDGSGGPDSCVEVPAAPDARTIDQSTRRRWPIVHLIGVLDSALIEINPMLSVCNLLNLQKASTSAKSRHARANS